MQDYGYLAILIDEVCQQRKLRLSGSSKGIVDYMVKIVKMTISGFRLISNILQKEVKKNSL